MSGEVIDGRFEIGPVIGRGGFGDVHRALDRETGDHVAVKRLALEFVDDAARVRFDREARLLARTNSPHIVRYITHGRDAAGRHYIVTEWLAGEVLSVRIARARMPVSTAVAIVEQAAAGLGTLHGLGILHRDVKPSNIMLTGPEDDPRVTLIDLGIAFARGEASLTARGMVVGSPFYISPEQARGEALTAASDLYSLGVVFFEMVTGTRPFVGADPVAVVQSVLVDAPPRASSRRADLSPALDAVIARALAKKVGARFLTPTALAESARTALDGFADGDDTEVSTVAVPAPHHDDRPSEREAANLEAARARLAEHDYEGVCRACDLALARSREPVERFEFLLLRCDAAEALARFDQMLRDATEARDLAATSAPMRVAAVQRLAQAHQFTGYPDKAIELLRATLAACDPKQLPLRLHTEATLQLAHLFAICGRAAIALERARAVLDDTTLSDEVLAAVQTQAEVVIGLASLALGDLDDALAAGRAAYRSARASGDVRRSLHAGTSVGLILNQLGAFDDAARFLAEQRDEARRCRLVAPEGYALHNLGLSLARTGDLDAGLRAESEALIVAERHGLQRLGAAARLYIAQFGIESGTPAGRARAERALDAAEPLVEPYVPMRAMLYTLRARVLMASRRVEDAVRTASHAFLLLEKHRSLDEGEESIRLTYVRCLYASDRVREADELLARARDRLLEKAARLRDDALRGTFLARVPDHRALLDLAEEHLGLAQRA